MQSSFSCLFLIISTLCNYVGQTDQINFSAPVPAPVTCRLNGTDAGLSEREYGCINPLNWNKFDPFIKLQFYSQHFIIYLRLHIWSCQNSPDVPNSRPPAPTDNVTENRLQQQGVKNSQYGQGGGNTHWFVITVAAAITLQSGNLSFMCQSDLSGYLDNLLQKAVYL